MLKSNRPLMTDLPRAKNALRTAVLLSVMLLLSVSSASGTQACPEYAKHRVTEYEVKLENPSNRRSHNDPSRGLSAVGDFDGDGHVDEAFFIRKDNRLFLAVCLDEGARLVKLWELTSPLSEDDDGNDSVWARSPGIYLSSIAKDIGGNIGDPMELELAHEGIQLHYKGARLFYWADGTFKMLYNGS